MKAKKNKPLCPGCAMDCVCHGKKLKDDGEYETDWYGKLHYWKCTCCKERFVSEDGGKLEVSAI